MKRLAPFLLLLGCGPLPPSGLPPQPLVDTCGASSYATLIGQDATELERTLILRQVRVIRPGDAVTLDFVEARLNFHIGDTGRITRISCG